MKKADVRNLIVAAIEKEGFSVSQVRGNSFTAVKRGTEYKMTIKWGPLNRVTDLPTNFRLDVNVGPHEHSRCTVLASSTPNAAKSAAKEAARQAAQKIHDSGYARQGKLL